MDKLLTPFGEIKILIDSESVPYDAQEGRKLENGCPNVLGRYHIAVRFIPDGKEHTIACVFESGSSYERSPESGERLECQGFYNDQRYKMSIGVEFAEIHYSKMISLIGWGISLKSSEHNVKRLAI